MTIRGIRDEDFTNYKEPSMFISAASCTFKCEKESGVRCCQNSALASAETINAGNDELIIRYRCNPITSAVVFGGLEPFDQIDEILSFIHALRKHYHCDDTVVIYTGYDKTEISSLIEQLKAYKNIVVKFGRFIPDQESRFDEILGIELASPNQYAERIC